MRSEKTSSCMGRLYTWPPTDARGILQELSLQADGNTGSPMSASGESLLILIPSFNDWAALRLLLPGIDRAMTRSKWSASLLIVDDASTDPIPDDWPGDNFDALESVTVLHLRCNLGHQRAIALGLYHAHEFTDAAAVLVMDGDGEDRAEDLPKLLEEFERGGRRERS